MGGTVSSRSRCEDGEEPTPRTTDGKPPGAVPTGPVRTVVTGFAVRSNVPERRILPEPTAWRSPLTTRGLRARMLDIAPTSRSCCLSHPSCQKGFGTAVVRAPASESRMSGYHSPHFPALHPIGFEGAWTTCRTPAEAVRASSHSSTFGSRKTAVGPSVMVRRTS